MGCCCGAQKKGKMDVAQKVAKAHAQAGELEKQVRYGVVSYIYCSVIYLYTLLTLLSLHMQIDKLKKELESQEKEKGSLESHAAEADKKTLELNSKLEIVSQSSCLVGLSQM